MRLINIDDDRNCYIGFDGEYEKWNIDPDVLAEAETVEPQQWIPVTERLPEPEDGQEVLVTVEGWYDGKMFDRKVDGAWYSGSDGYIDGFDTFNDWIEYGEWKVTAWMPLPKPFREGGES